MEKFKLMVGADPELFLKMGRSFVGAEGVIPGDKHKPYKVDKGAVQVDGMAVEFNIDPASDEDMFVDHVQAVMSTLDEMVGEHKLVCKPSVTFNEEVWKGVSEDSKILGCEPDFNAWTGKANPKPNGAERFRTAAGHIHIGWTEDEDINDPHHIKECEAIVKELDFRLGYPSLLLDPDTKRRSLYGAAGAYRPKSYGVEYRVLSNFWLLEERFQRWVYQTVENTLKDLSGNGKRFADMHGTSVAWKPAKIINSGDTNNAKVYIGAFNELRMPHEV